ncbi:hypothetical protein [Mycolicibacterium sp. CBMA 226]|uniref:hypothetical protein n=1 Tax=Mycolicibacterium sp. CBMA 226 TaxID=2606611 RepID=UPI0012DF9558|nr:hypothetical protein [Mycolicibacterium sp. CBMA 226]MUL78938.1 hypothetical protein [Mycolicibacterium sp. CBMA 226]QGW61247.1 hypothetical protein ICEMyc226_00215 [Mycolicibacterium sp.]
MPRKNTANTVLGMLSTTGAQTRPADREPEGPAPVADPRPVPESVAPQPVAPPPDPVVAAAPAPVAPPVPSVRTLPPVPVTHGDSAAPRTMRLRTSTATELRAAWLEAKRDDVLLTAQDFASDLLDEALRRQRRRRTVDAS